MKIAIISDVHDNLANLKKFFDWFKKNKIEIIICCGDVTNNETLKKIADSNVPIFLVSGNIKLFDDIEVEQYKNITYFQKFGTFTIDNKKIGLCHEPEYIKNIMEQKKDCNIIFYGHTHKPWEKQENNTLTVNPGTLGGTFQRATFAFWNTKINSLELKILDLL